MSTDLIDIVAEIQKVRRNNMQERLVELLEKQIPGNAVGKLIGAGNTLAQKNIALAEFLGYKFAKAAKIQGATIDSVKKNPRRVRVRHPWVRGNKNVCALWCTGKETRLIFQWCNPKDANKNLFPVVTQPPGIVRFNQNGHPEVVLSHTYNISELVAQVEMLGEAVRTTPIP